VKLVVIRNIRSRIREQYPGATFSLHQQRRSFVRGSWPGQHPA